MPTQEEMEEQRQKILAMAFSLAPMFDRLRFLADWYINQLNGNMLTVNTKDEKTERDLLLLVQSVQSIHKFIGWLEGNITEYRKLQEKGLTSQKVGKYPFAP